MKSVVTDIVGQVQSNEFFRHVLVSGKNTQVVVMSLKPAEEIGEETHADNDQVLLCVEGAGKVVLDGEEASFEKGDLVLVNAGVKHNFINSGASEMKILTTYSPPHHPEGTIHKTKQDAEQAEY